MLRLIRFPSRRSIAISIPVYRKPRPLRGYLYIGAASFLWGVAATMGRAAFTGRLLPGGEAIAAIDPLILSQTRTGFTFLVLFAALVWRRGWASLGVPRRDLAWLAVLGVAGLAASNFTYYVAIQRTNVATAIILQYTAPIWVLLYLALRGTQKPKPQQVAAVGLALPGIALLIDLFGAGQFRMDRLGIAAAMLSAFAFAFYNVSAHGVLARYDRWRVLLYVTGSAALFWTLVNPPWNVLAGNYSPRQWTFMAVFAVVSALGPFAFYAAGLQHLDPARAMIAACMEPVFAILLASIALGEVIGPMQLAGGLLVLGAIVVVEWPGRRKPSGEVAMEPLE
ncbi:MAG TPA: DMT family transporter [Terriglobia bacterium]|nr:DMT family transporter [Terriglobia bacterium]